MSSVFYVNSINFFSESFVEFINLSFNVSKSKLFIGFSDFVITFLINLFLIANLFIVSLSNLHLSCFFCSSITSFCLLSKKLENTLSLINVSGTFYIFIFEMCLLNSDLTIRDDDDISDCLISFSDWQFLQFIIIESFSVSFLNFMICLQLKHWIEFF